MNKKKEKYKILFISERLQPTPTANAINTYNIIEEMFRRGHNITYIAINQDDYIRNNHDSSINIYCVKSTNYGRLLALRKDNKLSFLDIVRWICFKLIRRITNILYVFKFPDVDPKQSKEAYLLAQKLHEKEKFDCMISVFRPFSAVSAAIKMKETFPNLLCGAYYLDLISGATKPRLAPKRLYNSMCYKGEIKAFKKLDFIIMAKGGKNIYSKDNYNKVNDKIEYADFPVFKTSNNSLEKNKNIEGINLVYAGTLDINFRNPEYALKSLKVASQEINNVILNIYGGGNCSKIIKKYKKVDSMIICEKGRVKHEVAYKKMREADIIINISNKTENIVPSKIFEIFSTGKPVINFVSSKNDISENYFSKYPAVCTINEWDDFDYNVNRLIRFILTEKGKQYDVSKIKKNFKENTPEFTADIVERKIDCLKNKTIREQRE